MIVRIANAYAESLITGDARRAIESNAYAKEILDERIAEVRAELEDAERKAIAYARQNGLVGEAPASLVPSGSGDEGASGGGLAPQQTIAATDLHAINQQYIEARSERIRAEQRWMRRVEAAASALPEVQESAAVQSLNARKAELQGEMADLRQRYCRTIRRWSGLSAQISALNGEIDALASTIKQTARNELRVAAAREDAFRRELAQVSGDTLNDQERRVRYGIINRDAEALRAQLSTLLARSDELTSAAQVKTSNISLLEPAVPPSEPFSPDMVRNMLTALVLGLGLAIALAVAREVVDDRIRSPRDAERKLSLPLLGFTPWSGEDPMEDLQSRHSMLSEAYASIRATISNAVPKRETLILQLTSSNPMEGKSTSAIAIAKNYHMTGKRVLSVDSDLRRPALHKYFGLASPDHGFVDALLGNANLSDVVIQNAEDGVDFLPLGKPPPNPVELLSGDLLQGFVEKYRANYDVIVFDGSPVMGLADAPLSSAVVDAVVFIVEANRAHFGQAKTAVRRMRDADAPLLGVVVTKFKAHEAGQSYEVSVRLLFVWQRTSSAAIGGALLRYCAALGIGLALFVGAAISLGLGQASLAGDRATALALPGGAATVARRQFEADFDPSPQNTALAMQAIRTSPLQSQAFTYLANARADEDASAAELAAHAGALSSDRWPRS